MTARAATSAVTAYLPTLRSVYSLFGRHPNPPLQTTIRFFSMERRDADTGDAGEPFVTYDPTRKVEFASSNDDEPIFLARCRRTINGDACYAALSVEDDGNLSPKYYIHPPFPPISGDPCHDALELEKNDFCKFLLFENEPSPKPSAYRSCSSSNGLLCFHNMKSEIFLWNPTTNESKILPPSPSIADPAPRMVYHIHSSGIWVDLESQDYKVMRCISAYIDDEYPAGYPIFNYYSEIELYSLKTGCWKRISCPRYTDFRPPRACMNGLHGVYYFTALSDEDNKSVIFSFDFSTETISCISTPKYFYSDLTPDFHLLDYNGLPSSLLPCKSEKSYKHHVRRDGRWREEAFFHTRGVDRPISFSRNGRLLFFESSNGQVLAFDCATGKLKQLDVCASAYVLHLIPFSKSSVKLDQS